MTKAISVRQPWASLIAEGIKTVEVRSWRCMYRGELAICASAAPDAHGMKRAPRELAYPLGAVVCVVDVVDCKPLRIRDAARAAISPRWLVDSVFTRGKYGWHLTGARRVTPVAVRGRLGIFSLPDDVPIVTLKGT